RVKAVTLYSKANFLDIRKASRVLFNGILCVIANPIIKRCNNVIVYCVSIGRAAMTGRYSISKIEAVWFTVKSIDGLTASKRTFLYRQENPKVCDKEAIGRWLPRQVDIVIPTVILYVVILPTN